MEITELLEQPEVRKILILITTLIVVYFLTRIIKRGLNNLIQTSENKYRARKATNVLAYILILISIVIIYSKQLGAFGVVLGLTGAGIAFALQELIVSFVGWLSIVFTNKIIIGQRIQVGEIKGDIIDIGVLSTTLMEIGDWVQGDQYNGRIVNISNSFIFKEKIQNYSQEYPFLWDEVYIPIKHGSDHKLAKELFNQIAIEVCGDFARKSQVKWDSLSNKFAVENAEVNPMITLTFDENWINIVIRYVVDYKKRRSTKDMILTRVLEEVANHKDQIEIATSSIDVKLLGPNNEK